MSSFFIFFSKHSLLYLLTKPKHEEEKLSAVQMQWGQNSKPMRWKKDQSVPVRAPSFHVQTALELLHRQQSRANPFFYVLVSPPGLQCIKSPVTWVGQVSVGIVTRGFWARCLGTSRRPSACGRVSRCCDGSTLSVYWRSRSSSESRSRPDGRRHSVTLFHNTLHFIYCFNSCTYTQTRSV